jgi:hypothetical protein
MTAKRILAKLIALFALWLAINGYAGAGSVASGSGECIAGDARGAQCNVIEGSTNNNVLGNVKGATIGGGGGLGFPNQVTLDFGTIGGGLDNKAGDRATVSGGSNNTASGFRATIGGGEDNTASGENSTIAGGYGNIASHSRATVGGGAVNIASYVDATVAGGSGNTASFSHATVSGGAANTANSLDATVAGGSDNTASGAYSTVSGGSGNAARGLNAAVSGGVGNSASGENANVGGGMANRATGKYSTLGGGLENVAGTSIADQVEFATVGGGSYNTAGGMAATVPGGMFNNAGGDYSFAAGHRARIGAGDAGTFLFADSNDLEFNSAAANEFAVRATGGVRFVSAIDSSGSPSAGVRLAKGSGSWESLSDLNAKANLAPVDPREILKRLVTIPITAWNYKTEDPSIRHIGPLAQDFHLFGFGEDDKHISTVDADGVALAAIQGLYQMMQEKDHLITAQQQEIAALKTEIVAQQSRTTALEARLTALEQAAELNGTSVRPATAHSPGDGLILAGVCLISLIFVSISQPFSNRGSG